MPLIRMIIASTPGMQPTAMLCPTMAIIRIAITGTIGGTLRGVGSIVTGIPATGTGTTGAMGIPTIRIGTTGMGTMVMAMATTATTGMGAPVMGVPDMADMAMAVTEALAAPQAMAVMAAPAGMAVMVVALAVPEAMAVPEGMAVADSTVHPRPTALAVEHSRPAALLGRRITVTAHGQVLPRCVVPEPLAAGRRLRLTAGVDSVQGAAALVAGLLVSAVAASAGAVAASAAVAWVAAASAGSLVVSVAAVSVVAATVS